LFFDKIGKIRQATILGVNLQRKNHEEKCRDPLFHGDQSLLPKTDNMNTPSKLLR
jgi:hypothetical protein